MKKGLLKKILKVVLRIIGILLVLLIVGTFFLRGANYIHHNIEYKDGVNETSYIDLNGQRQYVMMMGQKATNPVIIYLHGGPSSPDTCMTYSFSDYLTDEYTVVCWDQRGCGRTYYKNQKADPDNKTATFNQALEDVDALVDYTCERFNQDKVIIMGHSYGTVLGSEYVREHPEKVQAYIGVGQLVSLNDADMYSYEDALAKAQKAGDDTKEMEEAYDKYCQNPGIPTLLELRNYTSKYHPVEKEAGHLGLALFSPYAGINDLRWLVKQMGDVDEYVELNKQLFDFVLQYDAYKESMDYAVPVCMISGEEDWVCPTDKTADYLEALNAPAKQMYAIEGCGHDVHCAAPEEFADDVKEFLKDNLK